MASVVDVKAHDAVVVGSSPLMLLQARKLAIAGKKVCVVDKSAHLGGAWQTRKLANGTEVEVGCHLIECFPGVYEYLERETGVPFVVSKNQPIRVNRAGRIFPYHSRAMLALSGLRMALSLVSHGVVFFATRKRRSEFANYRVKLGWFLKYQLGALFDLKEIRFPASGFAQFKHTLVSRAADAGVRFERFDVRNIVRDRKIWKLTSSDGAEMTAPVVYCSASANLRCVSSGIYERSEAALRLRRSIVVSLSRDFVVQEQSYVAFWRDWYVRRISTVINPQNTESTCLFLVECGPALLNLDADSRKDVVARRLVTAGIIDEGGSWEEVESVDCELLDTEFQLEADKRDDSFVVLASNGNFAAGLAAWLGKAL